MNLGLLKDVLIVIGIIIVGAFIIYALAHLVLAIVDPHGKNSKSTTAENQPERQIVYQQAKLIEQGPSQQLAEDRVDQRDVQDVDLNKARQEELALNQGNSFASLNDEEDAFIKEKQRSIEERLAAKSTKEEPIDEIDLDDIFVEDEKEETPVVPQVEEEDDDEDIDALISRILAESEEDEEKPATVEQNVATIDQEVEDEVEEVSPVKEEPVVDTESQERVKALEEELARQREEYESKLQDALNNAKDEEAEEQANARIAELEKALAEKDAIIAEKDEEKDELSKAHMAELEKTRAEKDEEKDELSKAHMAELEKARAEKEALIAERDEEQEELTNARIAELEKALAEKEALIAERKEEQEEQEELTNARIAELERELAERDARIAEAENKPTGAMLSLEEYEARLETLKDRLKINDKELRAVKKEYLPLAKIKKSWEKDKVKLRRKEALVAKQKVVLYGVNNYVDIDEEKAKKLSEDLDLLDGLRLSVQHCEEVMKANEERFPILENSYNILLATNENLKADIEECNARIAELKANQE